MLEGEEATHRHLQVSVEKPCVSAYFRSRVLPRPGERSLRFFALASELRRIGVEEDRASVLMLNYYRGLPREVVDDPGEDGRPFSEKEAEAAVSSAYRSDRIRSYGCNSGMWSESCPGPDVCLFRKQISRGVPQSPTASHWAFLPWLGAVGNDGKKALSEGDVRVYLALELIEHRRGYRPGSTLFVSWAEIARAAGIKRQNVGSALIRLHFAGLIRYKKGTAQQRGTASEVTRIIPVPKPPKPKRSGTD